ncbi:TIGR03747 family integrating conjugative element membrane protein [Aggregatibacter actinomycetemcomitans]|uniref:TIGR03747 family integrating conjugative element membrane protein n=1 Tax=Aggregatibacter actinomycetemcomitans TaxID=714 RepID=UPI00197BE893|nr:TIGR03747 family integrating conjugative element membrane protein [Aggregatibacter actinomycetemcomitans]MBN6079263.1 TIGR03747 family integrating conjugative element membrane protein [Aggregatibacter actinomycetemcomitans]
MADGPENKQPLTKKKGIISRLFSLPGKVIGILFASLILSIIFEWIGITWFWPEQGYQHSQEMMMTEMGWFENHFTDSLLHSSPVQLAQFTLAKVNNWLFVKTGISTWLSQADGGVIGHYGRAYIESIMYVTLTFCIRVMIIVFTLPLFMLSALVGLTDGLVRRDLRRFGRGYESSFIYHNAKRTVLPIIFVAWAIYLSIPFSLHPNWILLPAAGLFGLAISVVSGSFKKYL